MRESAGRRSGGGAHAPSRAWRERDRDALAEALADLGTETEAEEKLSTDPLTFDGPWLGLE